MDGVTQMNLVWNEVCYGSWLIEQNWFEYMERMVGEDNGMRCEGFELDGRM